MERTSWKKAEVQFLKDNCALYTNEELRKRLERDFGKIVTTKQVRNKVYRITKEYGQKQNVSSLCWDCYRSCGEGRGCSWVNSCSVTPVTGWKIIEKPLRQPQTKKRLKTNGKANNIIVLQCPLYLGDVKAFLP
jgi:hypothetical protein